MNPTTVYQQKAAPGRYEVKDSVGRVLWTFRTERDADRVVDAARRAIPAGELRVS